MAGRNSLFKNKPRDKWNEVLEYINTKRTHDPAFQALFKEILEDKKDPCHQRLKTLSMLYDFTPIQPIFGSEANNER